ncbi:MAG: hypothetical protein Tsb009_03220 [Planctomycetaceae bacterium]
MMNSGLEFEYHDGWIQSVTIGPRQEVNLSICLDTVWNPNNKSAEVRFGGISNFPSVKRFFDSVAAETSEIDGGPLIHSLHVDDKVINKPGDLYYFIDVEAIGDIRIHCKNFTERSTE